MSQFSRTFATAASSFASKRGCAQNIRLPSVSIASPTTVGSYSNPASPNTALFPVYGGRTPTQSQVPFSGNPQLPLGISPASQPQITFWTTSPPHSPSQLQFRISQVQQQPAHGGKLAVFNPTHTQNVFDFGFGTPATESASPIFSASPVSTTRSISPASFDAAQESHSAPALYQPPTFASVTVGRKTNGDMKKGLNPFTYYRKTFPARYAYIDALIPTQMERSRLTGAFWQHESATVRFQCEQAVRIERTPNQVNRLENIRLQTQQKRKAEREKLGTDKLEGRNALIFNLWRSGATPEMFRDSVGAYDRENPLPEPARKRRRKATTSKADAQLLLAAETLSIASSSPQASVVSLTHSPATSFSPELAPSVLEKQDNWMPLVQAITGTAYSHPDTAREPHATANYTSAHTRVPSVAVLSTNGSIPSQFHSSAMYDGFGVHGQVPSFALGGEANFEALMDAYSLAATSQPIAQDIISDMDYDFNFTDTLPTEEDGLAFDAAYFVSS